MVNIATSTDGRGVRVTYSRVERHPNLGTEMANLELAVGDTYFNIRFESWDEMIRFCDHHNFRYDDKRGD